MRVQLEAIMAQPLTNGSLQLVELVSKHLDSIITSQEVYFYESAAYFARREEFQSERRAWYQVLDKHFCKLVRTINPHWKKSECEQRELSDTGR